MIINLQVVKEYFHENMPIVIIPYKYIALLFLVLLFLFIGASFISPPANLIPLPDSTISPNPIFRFEINKNFMYRNYTVKVLTKRGEHKIRVRETGNNITVTPISPLLSSDKIDLEIAISKGFSFFSLWSKTFNYSYTVSR